MLLWDKVKVFLGNLQPAMGSDNIRVFNIFLIQVAELPVRLLGTLRVLEVGDLAENSNLFDQALKSANVNREGRAVSSCFKALLLILAKLFSPDSDHLLQLGASQKAKGSFLADSLVIQSTNLLLQPVTESFTKIGEFVFVSIGAKGCHDLLPVGQIRVVYNIPEVLSDDRCEQADVVRTASLLRKIVFLGLLDALRTATDSNHESVRHTVFFKGHIESLFEIPKEKSSGDSFFCFGFRATEDLEGVVGLGFLRCSDVREETISFRVCFKHRLQTLVLLAPCAGFLLLLFSLSAGLFLLVQSEFSQTVCSLIGRLILESKVFHKALLGVLRNQSLNDLPVRLVLFTDGVCGPRFANAAQVTLLECILESLSGIANRFIHFERADPDLRRTLTLLSQANGYNTASETERSAAWPFEPLGGLGK